jgi:hypothetical protein
MVGKKQGNVARSLHSIHSIGVISHLVEFSAQAPDLEAKAPVRRMEVSLNKLSLDDVRFHFELNHTWWCSALVDALKTSVFPAVDAGRRVVFNLVPMGRDSKRACTCHKGRHSKNHDSKLV